MSRRVLLVDDHAPFRQRLRQLLEADGYEVVGEAADARECTDRCPQLKPDVVLLDVHLPDALGFDVVAGLGHERAQRVILISTHDEDGYRARALACGARGFITKASLSVDAIEELLH